ncbi:ROK family protein [Williamsia sp. CHRR-6]|uniref:ROK family protein n=1 Tax=Williamsia sp. CHRR-6 TaxID=2835871 RepID=UPI001BDB167D|nr:ROK family protein [Williamsia sp. CHRR-6]MBT0566398.1 ROK family protein [Williamsia sp. CHRR-6]
MTEAVLAVDLGGTKVEAGLVTADGAVLTDSRRRGATGARASAHELAAVIGDTVRAARTSHPQVDVIGVGIAAPGPVNEIDGQVVPINLPVLEGFALRTVIARAAGADESEVEFRRDGVAVALGEHWLGAARGADHALVLVISTGIGGGLIVNGTPLGGNAGHIGQMEISGVTGADCLGRTTMLESVASGPNTVAWAVEQGFSGATGEDLAVAYAAGDPIAQAAVVRCANAVGQAIGSAIALVPVQVVAIGGGFTRVSTDLVDLIAAEVARHPLPYVAEVPVVGAGLGADAPLIGAAALIYRRQTLPPRR